MVARSKSIHTQEGWSGKGERERKETEGEGGEEERKNRKWDKIISHQSLAPIDEVLPPASLCLLNVP